MKIHGIAALLAFSCLACGPRTADNLLVISFDTTRADRVSAYGYPLPTTPTIDALARRGVLFEDAYTHVPSTLPAHCSLFTGELPPGHGVRCNGRFRLAEEQLTLAERLRAAGFATGAIIGAVPLARRFGLDQGFDEYDDRFSYTRSEQREDPHPEGWFGHPYTRFERRADEVTQLAVGWLAQRRQRWFLFVHYFDPHTPYAPPDPWAGRFTSPYDAEIAFADDQLDRLLEAVAALPGRTLIVLVSDHGEGLGDHGEPEHNRYVYDSTLRVPWVLTLEGRIAAGSRVKGNVGLIDLLPTALELLGLDVPPGLPGRSLVPVLDGETELEPRALYAENLTPWLEAQRPLTMRALVEETSKLIWTDEKPEGGARQRTVELYDLAADPDELDDLVERRPELAGDLGRRLGAWATELEAAAATEVEQELDAATREALESLGYLK